MKIKIKLHPNSSQEKISDAGNNEFEIWIKEKPLENKANTELLKVLKKYFKKEVKIISGVRGRNKIIEVFD